MIKERESQVLGLGKMASNFAAGLLYVDVERPRRCRDVKPGPGYWVQKLFHHLRYENVVAKTVRTKQNLDQLSFACAFVNNTA